MRRPRFRAWPFFLPAALIVCAFAGIRGYAAWQLHRAERAFERDVGSLDYRTYEPAPVKDEDNAAIPIREAVKAFPFPRSRADRLGKWSETLSLSSDPPSSWTPRQRERIDRLLEPCQRSLGLLRGAVQRRSSNMDLAYGTIGVTPDFDLLTLAHAWKTLILDGLRASDRANPERAVDDVAAMEAVARAMEHERTLLVASLGLYAERQAWLPFHEIACGSALDRGAAGRLLEAIPTKNADDVVSRGVAFEGAEVVMMYRSVLRDASLRARILGSAQGDLQLTGSLDAIRDQYARHRAGQALPLRKSGDYLHLIPKALSVVDPRRSREIGAATVGDFADYWERATVVRWLRVLERAALRLRIDGLETGRYPVVLAEAGVFDPELHFDRRRDGSAWLWLPAGRRAVAALRKAGYSVVVDFSWHLPAPRAVDRALTSHAPSSRRSPTPPASPAAPTAGSPSAGAPSSKAPGRRAARRASRDGRTPSGA